ncbi:hypothetical protein Bca4012_059426 [Brassica carinata]
MGLTVRSSSGGMFDSKELEEVRKEEEAIGFCFCCGVVIQTESNRLDSHLLHHRLLLIDDGSQILRSGSVFIISPKVKGRNS